MKKANKIYLERLRKNDFVERKQSSVIFKPITLQELSEGLREATAYIKQSMDKTKYSLP